MGAYNSTYVGIFLEVPIMVKEVEKEILKNSQGKVFNSGKFDPDTGEELIVEKVYDKKKVYPISYFEVDGKDNYDFWSPEYHQNSSKVKYFLLNGDRRFSKKIEPGETLELSEIDIPNLIEELKKKYSFHLEYYKNIGYEVKIKWGIVNYAH